MLATGTAGEDLVFAFRGIHALAVAGFDLADAVGQVRPLVEPLHDLAVQAVDLPAQLRQGISAVVTGRFTFGHGAGVGAGRPALRHG
jgi:hypothetical protein